MFISLRKLSAVTPRGLSARSFAAKAAVNLPISLFGEHATYANSLYRTAVRANQFEKVENDIYQLSETIRNAPELRSYLGNPIISRSDKKADMEKITTKLGLSKVTRAFVGIMAENGRLNEIELIIAKFEELLKAKHGIVEASVKTATPISDSEKAMLAEAIKKNYMEAGKQLKTRFDVDKTILGGIQLQVGDKFLDLSVQSQIKKLSAALAVSH